ncbi:Transcriptional protein SWT1 [Channa argus]|uniref:Transcriptional protein SWT1 n=1 Tax=Channa argus TaxID=215402 RepID=A0A6G1PL27_CHAAH|nr:Transcriptional protein SWT1 [Channa argus]
MFGKTVGKRCNTVQNLYFSALYANSQESKQDISLLVFPVLVTFHQLSLCASFSLCRVVNSSLNKKRMSKKSKKRKRRKLSSSSSEEDVKASKDKDVTNICKIAKRKQDVRSQESCAAKKGNLVSSTDSQSNRQIKKPIYRLAKTKAADQKPVSKDEDYTKTESVHAQSRGGNSSSKAKPDISGKDNSVSGSRTKEKELSKPLSIHSTIAHRTENCSKDSKSSQRRPSKFKKQLMSPSWVSFDQKEQQNFRTKEPSTTGHDSNTDKTREPCKTSFISKDSSRHNRKEHGKKTCQNHLEKMCEARSSSKEAQIPSAATRKPSSTLSKHNTSERSSKVLKNVTSVLGSVTSVSHNPAKSSSQQQIHSLTPWLPRTFKIPKKVQPRPVNSTSDNNDSISTNTNLQHETELSDSVVKVKNSMQENASQPHSSSDDTPSFSCEGRKNKWSSLLDQLPSASNSTTEPWCDQMQVVEELHLARSEKRLGLNVMQSYGELTCMEIDPPEKTSHTPCRETAQQDLILILDTNILLSHLDYVKKITSHGLGDGLNAENNDDRVLQCCLQYQSLYPGCALILCTNDKNLCSKALFSGVRALSKNDLEEEVRGSKDGLCPLQNLQTRMLSHTNVQMPSPVLSRSSTPVQQQNQNRTGISLGRSERVYSTILYYCFSTILYSVHTQCVFKQLIIDGEQLREDSKTKWDLSRCVSELEDCLREVLSDVLEVEMKAAYEDLWLEIVYVKPPWTLQDVLQCLKKHWIAVFGHIVQRRKQQNVLNLIEFFNSEPYRTTYRIRSSAKTGLSNVCQKDAESPTAALLIVNLIAGSNYIMLVVLGKTMDCSATLVALKEAKELVKEFGKSSSRIPSAISQMDNIFNKLQPQVSLSKFEVSFVLSERKLIPLLRESPAADVVMNDDDEDKLPRSSQVSNQEVWALFENIWSNVCQISLEVFKAMGFDPHTMRSAHPVRGPPPPQEALACLHKLSSIVSQLLQAFSSVLSSAPGLEEVQTLFTVINSNKIINENSRFTAKDLLDCFSQQDYREKLRIGGAQLMELKEALDRCAEATGQNLTFST